MNIIIALTFLIGLIITGYVWKISRSESYNLILYFFIGIGLMLMSMTVALVRWLV